MKPKILIVTVILVLCLLFAFWDLISTPLSTNNSNPQISELNITPKPFTFKTMDGKLITSQTFKGKIVVLNFWASWCVPCTVEFPDLIKFTSPYPNDIIFLALSVDEKQDNARRFVSRFKDSPQKNRIIGLDTDKKISQDIFQTTKYPETYILDRNLTIRRHIVGVIDWTSADIHTIIEHLIAEKQ